MLKTTRSDLLWTMLLLAGAILLWRAALALAPLAAFPVHQGERLTFALVVSAGILAFTLAAARHRRAWPTWAPLRRKAVVQFGLGFLCYAGLALIAIGAVVLAGAARIEFEAPPEAGYRLAYLLALVLLSEALPEELLFRGWLMQALTRSGSPWAAILGQAALFTAFAWAVGGVGSLDDASFIACFGLMLGVVRAATGSVWAPMGLHLAFIAAQQSALPQWDLWSADPHSIVQIICLTLVPFSVVVAMLFGRVRPLPDRVAEA